MPKKGAWTVCKFGGGGGLGKKEGAGVFDGGGWYPNAHYDNSTELSIDWTSGEFQNETISFSIKIKTLI